MGKPGRKPIDLDWLHRHFYEKRDRLGRVTILQNEEYKELGISLWTLCRKMKDMEKEGRIKRLSYKEDKSGVYLVRDPDFYK